MSPPDKAIAYCHPTQNRRQQKSVIFAITRQPLTQQKFFMVKQTKVRFYALTHPEREQVHIGHWLADAALTFLGTLGASGRR